MNRLYEVILPLLDRDDNPTIAEDEKIVAQLTLTPSGRYDFYIERPVLRSTGSGQLLDVDDNNDSNDEDSPLDLTELVKSELLDIADSCKSQATLLLSHHKRLLELAKTVKVDRPKISKVTRSRPSSHSSHPTSTLSAPTSAPRMSKSASRPSFILADDLDDFE